MTSVASAYPRPGLLFERGPNRARAPFPGIIVAMMMAVVAKSVSEHCAIALIVVATLFIARVTLAGIPFLT